MCIPAAQIIPRTHGGSASNKGAAIPAREQFDLIFLCSRFIREKDTPQWCPDEGCMHVPALHCGRK